MIPPILSIVIPTREGVPESWLQELLKVKGDVEIILVHPPGMSKYLVDEPRLQQINSPFRGEIMQRMTGLLNVSGTYTLTINCDEYITPDVLEITIKYFQKFPDSWVMRLSRKSFEFGDKAGLHRPWGVVPNLEELEISRKKSETSLMEIPIAPLSNKFDILSIFRGRKDHHGPHTENFDKKVWKTDMVQATLQDITKLMILGGPLKYIPFWCLDRLLGLFIQAKYYEEGKIIGHLMPLPEQIRDEDNPPEHKRTMRFYGLVEVFLIRRFPQYGYLWNLMVEHLRAVPIRAIASQQRKFTSLTTRKGKAVTPQSGQAS